jgi:hypothetical protein
MTKIDDNYLFRKRTELFDSIFFFKKLIIAEPAEKFWQELPTPAKRWGMGEQKFM